MPGENPQPIKLISDNTVEYRDGENPIPVTDLLQRKDIVNAVAGVIMGVKPPFTIGIYGSWGSGKTHFMQTVQQRIDESTDNSKPITVMFEAWLHCRDKNPEISLMQCAYDELERHGLEITPTFKDKWHTTFQSLISSLTVKINTPLIQAEFSGQQGLETYQERKKEASALLFDDLQEQMRLQHHFKTVLTALSEYDKPEGAADKGYQPHKIVFFIDDLDRCLPEVVIDMLEKIKLFMWHDQCVFVLGADQDAIQKAIKTKKYSEAQIEGIEERYLEKIVNFPFRLPPVRKEVSEIFFAEKVIEASPPGMGDKKHTKAIIELFAGACDAVDASLRAWVLLINTFTLCGHITQKIVDSGKPGSYDVRIMAVLAVLQVLHTTAFEALCKGQDEREGKLKAFFTGEGDEWELLLPKLSEAPSALADIHNQALEYGINQDTEFSSYVEFLVSQSEKAESLNTGYWNWFDKNDKSDDATYLGTFKQTIDWLRDNTKEGSSINIKVRIDDYSWRILTRQGNRVLLLSEYCIGEGPIDNPHLDYSNYHFNWAKSTLRAELNSPVWLRNYLPELYASGMICQDNNTSLGETGVFLLSGEQTERLLTHEKRSARRLNDKFGSWWWLRSSGYRDSNAAIVYGDGYLDVYGHGVDYEEGGVRPALWLNLESDIL
jgi:hypothetical protein